MKDTRFEALAKQIVTYSVKAGEGDRVLIDSSHVPDDMVIELIREIRRQGAMPHVRMNSSAVGREMLAGATDVQYAGIARHLLEEMKDMQCYIGLRGEVNAFEQSSVSVDAMATAMKHMRAVLNHRVNQTRWVGLRWPTPSMAQQAGMSTDVFEDFYFDACLMDYAAMKPAMEVLKKMMESTDKVVIKGVGTDLRFSIKGLAAVPCAGEYNIPDGEVFTAPVLESVNGCVQYNVPTVYQGMPFDAVRLVIKAGKIVEADAGSQTKTEALNKILDSDPGARYFGEFALGVNPKITKPMCNILFDEKIAGSFHLTPGQAYSNADNGNSSQVHWDLVCIQTPEYGGGEIYFDGKLVRKDGVFLADELRMLNPA